MFSKRFNIAMVLTAILQWFAYWWVKQEMFTLDIILSYPPFERGMCTVLIISISLFGGQTYLLNSKE